MRGYFIEISTLRFKILEALKFLENAVRFCAFLCVFVRFCAFLHCLYRECRDNERGRTEREKENRVGKERHTDR